jgi:hypothetical protein
MAMICIGGCAQTLPPHEELNQAFKRSFAASGYNYTSTSRITTLVFPETGLPVDASGKRKMALDAGVGLLKGLSVHADGAVDMKAKRAEVAYDLRYDRDNVTISVRIPLLVDYGTQTIYVGPSLLNTVLETLSPQSRVSRGKLIRIDVKELLREGGATKPELAELLSGERFSAKGIELINGAIKDGILIALAKLEDRDFSELPLTAQDRKDGVKRRIHLALGHDDAVAVGADLVGGVSLALFQGGLIGEKEHELLSAFTDKKMLAGLLDKVRLGMVFDVGIDPAGFVGRVESQLLIADREGQFQLGFDTVSAFGNYEAPRFAMVVEPERIVDFREVLKAVLADMASKQQDAPLPADTPDTAGGSGSPPPATEVP